MDTAEVPCELLSQQDSVTVILRPGITQSSWSDVEAFGANVRQELEQRTAPACLVDLSPMTYMGSAIVALIVRVWKVVQSQGGKMVVLCPNSAVLDVIRLAGLDKVWTVVMEPETARKKLGLRASAVTVDSSAIRDRGLIQEPVRTSNRIWYFTLGAVTALLALMVVLLYLGSRH